MPKRFKNICRAKRIPEASLRAGIISEITGENRLEVINQDDGARINISGAIGGSWYDDSGITSDEFNEALDSIPKGRKINVHVNSEGGSVQDGLGIYNALKARSKDVTACIDGYACSIASVIPLAASKVISPKSAIWMIHQASSYCAGNADDSDKNTRMLLEHDDMLSEIYASETGIGTPASWLADMKAETWKRGSEAVEYGLADEGDDESDVENALKPLPQAWLDRCKNIPSNILNVISVAPQGAGKPTKQPTQDSIMNRTEIIALLKSWGVTHKEDATDAELKALVSAGKPAAAPAASVQDIADIRAQLKASETRRVTALIKTYVDAQKITNDEVQIFVNAALSDEAGTIAILDKKEVAPVGGDPVGYGRIEVGTPGRTPMAVALKGFDPVQNIITEKKGDKGAIYNELIKNWDGIYAEACRRDIKRGMEPLNANSISGFTTAFLLSGSLTPLQNVWASLMAISKDYSPDPYKPLATPTLKNPTAASATLTDATTFNSGNSTVGALTATMHQYTQPFQISNTDLNSGLRMEDLVIINRAAFANKVIDELLTFVTAANFTATPVIRAPAAFGFADTQYLQGQLQKSDMINLILDGTYLASITNTPGFFQQAGTVFGSKTAWEAFGYNMIAKNSRWTAAGNNIKGFACNPQALIGIMGLPLSPANFPGGIFNVETILIPGINISVALYTWWDVNARTMWTSYDVMAGFALGDATAGIVVASATPS